MLTSPRFSDAVLRAKPDFASLRAREFARLDAEDHAYLDFTGSALYPDSLVASHLAMLRDCVLGNPHAESSASLASSALIAEARARVLHFLDANPDDYCVVFTSNATGALALVGSSYPFGRRTPLALTADNHNSVNGIREIAARAGSGIHYLPLDADLRFDSPEEYLAALVPRGGQRGLFAFPAQSNFSGVKHSLSLVSAAQAMGWRVLLDAAALVPMTRLSLCATPADFVALSFYKMFGYPTGLGALVVRHEALAELRRPWFSGGTVDFVSVRHEIHALRDGVEGFEDGTANFLGIGAVPFGLGFLEEVGLENIERHATTLSQRLIDALLALRHPSGKPMTTVYGARDNGDRGATVAFNVIDRDGVVVPYSVIEARARGARVSVRGGCFCNPGASEAAFGFPAELTPRCLAATRAHGWSIPRFAECMRGYAVGAVRASFGIPSVQADVDRLIRVIEEVGGTR